MQVASGKVINGRVVVEAELPEGADVVLLTLDGEETFEVDEELKAVLLESIRTAFVTEAVRRLLRESSDAPTDDEVALINKVADELNREAEDVLEYQVIS